MTLTALVLVSAVALPPVEAIPGEVILGGGAEPVINISIAAPVTADLTCHASVGDLRNLRFAEGKWRAELWPPRRAVPQVALIMALDRRTRSLSSVAVTYAAKTELKGKTEPGAKMQVRLGASLFGPVVAGDAGDFVVPLVVKPGQGMAIAESTDALGNRSRSRIDLFLPKIPTVHAVVVPQEIVAGASASIYIVSQRRSLRGVAVRTVLGSLKKSEKLSATAVRYDYTAPEKLPPPAKEKGHGTEVVDTIALRLRGWRSRMPIRLRPAAPARIWTIPPKVPLSADGLMIGTIKVGVADRFGNPLLSTLR